MTIQTDYDEIWLVFDGTDLLAVVDSEKKAEAICVMLNYGSWRKFISAQETEVQCQAQ